MAQGTGTLGVIALAAVALAVPGCGGDSDDSGSASAARMPQAATESDSQKQKGDSRVEVPTGEPERGPTPEQKESLPLADIELTSRAVRGESIGTPGVLSATQTCDGKNESPSLRWQAVPAGTAELGLFVMNLQPVDGELFFDWAVMGLDPELDGIDAGQLPPGAIVGRNSLGRTEYSICPLGGESEIYVFALYALPKNLPTSAGFEPRAVRKRVLREASNAGILITTYGKE